ncbi:PepSY domain-containing protein [Streptomyces sp. NPDC012794]|uniref:PepSY domain-containing protein n=1 Tax=Streptomyces sp. NPDC012794 TaxID=3364850 RepID=UPI0036D16801
MKRTLYVSAAASVVLMVAGPASAATAAVAAETSQAVPASALARVDATAEKAAEAALKAHPGVVESIDRDDDVWQIDVIGKDGSHTDVEVNVASGAVTDEESTAAKDRDEEDRAKDGVLLAAKVTAQEAMKTALAAHPGQAWSVNWDDDDDDGRAPYWDVEVKTSGDMTQNVHVDSMTGKVISAKQNGEDH